jgi:hypothetical protein
MNARRSPAENQSFPTSSAESSPPVRGPAERWRVRASMDFLDPRTCPRRPDGRPISYRQRVVMELLDGLCRDRCYCWPGNELLGRLFGCGVRWVQRSLRELERDGLIHCVMDDSTVKRVRLGIILRVRADPSSPVADTAHALTEAVSVLRRDRDRPARNGPPQGGQNGPPEADPMAPLQSGQIDHAQSGQIDHAQSGQIDHAQSGQIDHAQSGQIGHPELSLSLKKTH